MSAALGRIAELEAELKALRAEMQAFTHTVSHDLRAPLRHIISYALLVQEDAGPQLSAEVQGFLTTMSDSARHMGRQLDGLSALAQVIAAPITLSPVDLNALVQELVAKLAQQHPTRTLDWRVAPDLPTVQADTGLLRQALQQVLANAVKFSASRAVAVIDISAERVNAGAAQDVQGAQGAQAMALLRIRDNGVGYNPAQQGALFKVFGRLHNVNQFDGLGMGLVLSAKALQRMGGSVEAEGVVDGGCTVTLQLPLA